MKEIYKYFTELYLSMSFDSIENGVALFNLTATERNAFPSLQGFNQIAVKRVTKSLFTVELQK